MVEDRASSWTKALCALLVVGLSLAVVACTDDPSAEPAPEPAPPEETGPRNGGDLVVALADAGRDWSPAAAPWTPSQLEVGRTLYDRVAVNEGRPQRYGTQGRCTGPGSWEPRPIEEAANVDARRTWAEIRGFPRMADYRERMNALCR